MSSDDDLEEVIRQATRTCTTNQCMIDLTSEHLDELRTQCASTDKITQKEIKDAEVHAMSVSYVFTAEYFPSPWHVPT